MADNGQYMAKYIIFAHVYFELNAHEAEALLHGGMVAEGLYVMFESRIGQHIFRIFFESL